MGKPVTFRGATILRLAEGKVAEHWGYFDAVGWLRQLGRMPS
jgi:predicted ester cyclase